MNDKLAVGMYARTKSNGICKLYRNFVEDSVDIGIGVLPEIDGFFIDEKEVDYIERKDILKASFNIVDLIKAKDIILGNDGKIYQCWKIYKDYVFTYSKNKQGQTITFVDYQIDKVLTKEQFEQMSYRIGDEE